MYSKYQIVSIIKFHFFQKARKDLNLDTKSEFSFGCALFKIGNTEWHFQKWKFKASEMVIMAVFDLLEIPKLISRKIWVAEKSWNFHIKSENSCLVKILSIFYHLFYSFFPSQHYSKPSYNMVEMWKIQSVLGR